MAMRVAGAAFVTSIHIGTRRHDQELQRGKRGYGSSLLVGRPLPQYHPWLSSERFAGGFCDLRRRNIEPRRPGAKNTESPSVRYCPQKPPRRPTSCLTAFSYFPTRASASGISPDKHESPRGDWRGRQKRAEGRAEVFSICGAVAALPPSHLGTVLCLGAAVFRGLGRFQGSSSDPGPPRAGGTSNCWQSMNRAGGAAAAHAVARPPHCARGRKKKLSPGGVNFGVAGGKQWVEGGVTTR